MLNTVVKFIMTMGRTPAVKKFGQKIVNQAMDFIKKNPKKVEKLKSNVKQESAEDLPLFKKPKYDFSDLIKKTDTTKNLRGRRTKGMDISNGM
jgi:hypothetical protein